LLAELDLPLVADDAPLAEAEPLLEGLDPPSTAGAHE
jgi:hypothetical protein